MTERQLQFRIGLFVIVTVTIACTMIFFFGQMRSLWEQHYQISVRFDAAPGVFPGSPVTMNGVTIGDVQDVSFDTKRGGVKVIIAVSEDYRLRCDTQPQLVQSLLGDTTIEFSPGQSPEFLKPGALLEGEPPLNPMAIFDRVEAKLSKTMASLEATSSEWKNVGHNINSLVGSNRNHLDEIVARTADSLAEFTRTMKTAQQTISNANSVFTDPEHQENLRRTMAALPQLVQETRETIQTVKNTVGMVHQNLINLESATAPMATHSTAIVTKLDRSLGNLESLTGELNQFISLATKEDGSLHRFVSNPELYENLNRTAASLTVLMRNLQPVIQDLSTFSDKVARHPEVLGVSGAIKGSSGLKDPPADTNTIRQTGHVQYGSR